MSPATEQPLEVFVLQAANGMPPYQYALGSGSYGNATTAAYSASGLNAGSYIVNIKDFNGCTTSQTIVITQPSAALSSSISAQTNVSCFGTNTASYAVQATNGTAPYQYALGTGSYGNATTSAYSQNNVAAGSYTINIKDANGCTTSQTVIITQPSAVLTSSITTQTNVSCYGNSSGSFSVQAANGTAPYQYALGSSAYGNATSGTYSQSGLAAGNYTVNIKDANGCTTSQNVSITQPSAALSSSISFPDQRVLLWHKHR
jgi:phosphotransferase system IIB component